MRAYAVIIAGGVGSRMGQDIPKQFINVYDKPIIVYTLEAFQHNDAIDAIVLVCIEGWEEMVWAYARQFNIDKLRIIVAGGNTGQESIRNGVFALQDIAYDNDLVIIHDGIRPLMDQEVLSDVIRVATEKGNAVSALPYNEQIFIINPEDEGATDRFIPRETIRRVSTPQAYRFRILYEAYKKAFKEKIGIYGSHYVNTMMVELGETLYFAKGSDKNIKLTTREDLELFKAYLNISDDKWLR